MTNSKHSDHPQPVVGAMVVHKGKMLLITSGKKWGHPITAIEFGEEPLDSVKRLLGEYGLKAVPKKLIGAHSIMRQTMDRYEMEFAKEHLVCLEYFCKASSDRVNKDGIAKEVKWSKYHEIRRLPLQHYTEELLLMQKVKAPKTMGGELFADRIKVR